jgi:hypothetical protein
MDRIAWIGVAASVLTTQISVQFVGVPVNVLVACALGTYAAFGVESVQPRSRMWSLATASIIMGAAFTAIVDAGIRHWLHMEMTPGLHAGLGAAISFATRFALPWLADVFKKGKWLNWIPFLRKNGE